MINFRKIESYDNIKIFAEWIYSTDLFLFNHLFLNDEIRAVTGIERLIMSDYLNSYHRNFITIIYDNDPKEVQGIAVSFKGSDISIDQSYKAMHDTSCTSLPLMIQDIILNRVFSSKVKKNDYYLGNLFVNPSYRKNGIGSKLVEKCKQIARQSNCKYMLLDVEYSKPHLLDFYSKFGFKKDSKNYHKILGKTYGCYGLKHKLK